MAIDHGTAGIKHASKDPCPFLTLPLELITHIIEFVPPESHLDLAATCKSMASASAAILHLHQEAFTQFKVASDLQPATVPMLLRDACKAESSVKSWHVRSFEIWLYRDSWDNWKSFSPDDQQPLNPESEVLAYSFSHEDIKEYLKLARQHLHLSEEQLDDARRELHSGGDGFLKALLFSLCPRLRDIKFVKQEIPEGAQDRPEQSLEDPYDPSELSAKALHSLTWLKRAIWNTVDGGTCSWPPGFLALRTVAVGVRSGRKRKGSTFDAGNAVSFEVLCSLFRLPNISSLYFNNFTAYADEVGYDNEDPDRSEEAETSWRIPPRCSSVEHLYLDELSIDCREFSEAIVNAPKQLTSFSVRAGSRGSYDHVDSLVECLVGAHRESLKSLMFHGHGLTGYRCNIYQPDEGVLGYDDLRHLTVDAGDLILAYGYQAKTRDGLFESLMEGFAEQFPKSLEVLNVVGDATDFSHVHCDDLDVLDDCFARIIESGDWQNFKAIYLRQPEIEACSTGPNPRKDFAFRNTITAGRQHGVDVYAVSNKDLPKHHVDFPVAPDKYDLMTGPFGGSRPTDRSLKFDFESELWEYAGCGFCGHCDNCFDLYPEAVWDAERARLEGS